MKKKLLIAIPLLIYNVWTDAQSLERIRIKEIYFDKPLALVLLDLEIDHHLKFDVDDALIDGISVTASIKKLSINETLSVILQGTGLSFQVEEDRTIQIFERLKIPETVVRKRTPRRIDLTISGVVVDASTGESLPFATISVLGQTQGTETNVDGHFTLFHVANDTQHLVVNYLGYQTATFQLRPDLDMSSLVIRIDQNLVVLDEVLVSASKKDQMIRASSGISRIGMSPAALSSLPSYGEKDVFRSLQLLPGISGSNESSSGLFVRGGTPDQNLILFDDFTVYHVDHLFGFFSAFNANAIKDIQLYKGGFGAEFGGRLSSVVDMTGKDGNTEDVNAGMGLSLLSYNAYLEAPFDKGRGSFLIAGRRSFQSKFYGDLFDSFAGSNAAEATNQGVGPGRGGLAAQQTTRPNSFFYDLNAKMTYRFSDKDQLSLSLYNGEDNLDNSRVADSNTTGGRIGRFGGGTGVGQPNFSFSSENVDLSNWGNIGSSLRYARKWSDQLYTRASVSYSNYFSDRDRTNSLSIVREDTSIQRNSGSIETNNLHDFTIKLDNEWQLSQHHGINFGFQYTSNNINYDYIQNDTLNVIHRDDHGVTLASYLTDKWTIAEKLILKGGLRATHFSPTGNFYFEPRASLTYLVSDQIKLKGAYGIYNQFANRIVREDIQQGSRDFWLLSDDDIVPVSKASHYIAGASYDTKNFLFDVEAYFKDLSGLTEYSSRIQPSGRGPNRTLSYEESFYIGSGVARGFEFLLQKKTGKFNGWISYTLGQVKYDFDAFGNEPFFANQDQTHELKTVLNYKIRNWDLAATFIYATGRPYTAPTGYYEIELLDGTSEGYFEVSNKNGLRLPNYHRLDLSCTYNFKAGKSNLKTGLSLINIYDRANVWYKEFEVIEGELLVTDVSLIDFTPSLFITWDLK